MIIHPEQSTFKIFWDAFIYLGLALSFFLVPFTLAFDNEEPHTIIQKTFVWELIYDIAFITNIVLNFFTAY